MPRMSRPAALLRQRCPRCREGRVFAGLLMMRETCPVCGHRFEREPGYFVGAMYVSYGMALPLLAGLYLLVERLRPGWSEVAIAAAALALALPLVPPLFRYARLIWMHLDWTADPR
jgi:uncharacterized protein (DUF983 family)